MGYEEREKGGGTDVNKGSQKKQGEKGIDKNGGNGGQERGMKIQGNLSTEEHKGGSEGDQNEDGRGKGTNYE